MASSTGRIRSNAVFLLLLHSFLSVKTMSAARSPWTIIPSISHKLALKNTRFARVGLHVPVVDPSVSVPFYSSVLSTRGGASDQYTDDEDEDYDDDDFFGLDDGDFDMADDDFSEENTLDRVIDAWKKTPPFTKAYLTATFAATGLGYLTNKNQFPEYLLMEWKPIYTRLQVWRPFTAFLNFGPFGLGYVMTAHFMWTYMSTLERLNYDRPYDFWIMIFFGCSSMVAGYTFLKLSPRFLGHNLSTFLVYVWSRYHEGMEVSMFELFTARAEMLPWLFLAQTFLLEGEVPILDFLGIVFGHVYHHCKTTGMLRAPPFVVNWYNSDSTSSIMIRDKYKQISSDFEVQ